MARRNQEEDIQDEMAVKIENYHHEPAIPVKNNQSRSIHLQSSQKQLGTQPNLPTFSFHQRDPSGQSLNPNSASNPNIMLAS